MIALINPKYPANVGNIVRAASCFGVDKVYYTGQRIPTISTKENRLPREIRMYKNVEIIHDDLFFKNLPKGVTPIAVEILPGSESLPDFIHPENPLYIFGPEDGSIPKQVLSYCHRFVIIPSSHCMNLAGAVHITLYDRMVKRQIAGLDKTPTSYDILARNSR